MESDLLNVTLLSILVSGTATLLASSIAIPLGCYLGMRKFKGKELVRTVTYTLYGFPPVVAGLVLYILLSNSGPLGSLQLLFTPIAMILAQTLLVVPIVIGLTMSAVSTTSKDYTETAIILGADSWRTARTVIHEARIGIISAVMVGFGRALAEVGAVMLVGGNIQWHTRVLTTAIVLETREGNFEYGLALGAILLTIGMVFFYLMKRYQDKGMLT
ncbi:MAG: ABC transporter permease [Candidatus Thermoplasmatota archaeon]|nr:ABC transporter permease subunit [Euryarchaeota archaeon]MBU4032443.1 ABC transporter permease [Candidatus Thermoplasmatota archaeon]MBU4144477.1 ABC transporter permease [Candidatus Thermoplasmatota archaeon]MBU4592291.1 ABC transporter permease [Candidatus Thermoplasmatota archaeon]